MQRLRIRDQSDQFAINLLYTMAQGLASLNFHRKSEKIQQGLIT
jgi:hypothetical protein